MEGIEQGRLEGIGTPENETLTTPELLNLVEAQLWIVKLHQECWQDPEYKTSLLVDEVSEKVPLTDRARELLDGQVENLEKARHRVLGILESEKSPQVILREAFPDFHDTLLPLEMIPTPYSFHYRLDGDSMKIFGKWVSEVSGFMSVKKEGAVSLFSETLGIPISFRGELAWIYAAQHEITHDFFRVMIPDEFIDWERFKGEIDYAIEVLEESAKAELITHALDVLYTNADSLEFLRENGFPIVDEISLEIMGNFGREALVRLGEFWRHHERTRDVVEGSVFKIPAGRLPFLIANLEYREIYEKIPEAVELYEEERKRREAEEKAFSHLTVSAGLSVAAGIGAFLGIGGVPAAVFMSALGNDIRRVIKHDKARQFTFLEELGKD